MESLTSFAPGWRGGNPKTMIIVLDRGATESQLDEVLREASRSGQQASVTRSKGATLVRLDAPGDLADRLRAFPGVRATLSGNRSYVLSSRDYQEADTLVRVRDVVFGGTKAVLIAGPCSVETREQIFTVAKAVKAAGAHMLRGGAFKPRTSPWSFQGLGEEGLKLLAEVSVETGLPVVTEVMAPEQVDLVARYADMLQIGSRSVQNFPLLRAAGRSGKPVLLKRGMATDVDEFLGAADYILAEGNPNVVLCERGIRTFETSTRFTLDVVAIPLLEKLTHLPVIADPSHATGLSHLVAPAARAAIAAGADGLLIETHPDPREALSDGRQAVTMAELDALMGPVRAVAAAVGRSF